MIRNNQKIERPGQLYSNPRRGNHFLTPREPVGILRAKPVSIHESIARIRRMMVGVAEEDLRRISPTRIGGVVNNTRDITGLHNFDSGERGRANRGDKHNHETHIYHEELLKVVSAEEVGVHQIVAEN
jgi:hypothetical protein